MADLDDFFAKKDRKKTKGQKFATTDNMATSQEELLKKQEKQKKDRVLLQSLHSSENETSLSKEEEWNEYSEEIKDYTTLKIQNLTIDNSSNYSGNNDKDEEIEYEENEAGEMVPKPKVAGPWKVTEPEPAPPVKAPEPVVEKKPEVKKVYVPPGQRNQVHRSAPRMKTSLDVKNEEMFPVLQQGGTSTKKSVNPTAKKVETPAWSKYQ